MCDLKLFENVSLIITYRYSMIQATYINTDS